MWVCMPEGRLPLSAKPLHTSSTHKSVKRAGAVHNEVLIVAKRSIEIAETMCFWKKLVKFRSDQDERAQREFARLGELAGLRC